MHPESLFAIRHWDLPQILFVAAACFAMAAVGFFVAVFLQLQLSGQPASPTSNSTNVPIEDKVGALQRVSENSPQPAPGETRNQSDPEDENADAKLKLLNSLNQ
jgi:hypothetical protein